MEASHGVLRHLHETFMLSLYRVMFNILKENNLSKTTEVQACRGLQELILACFICHLLYLTIEVRFFIHEDLLEGYQLILLLISPSFFPAIPILQQNVCQEIHGPPGFEPSTSRTTESWPLMSAALIICFKNIAGASMVRHLTFIFISILLPHLLHLSILRQSLYDILRFLRTTIRNLWVLGYWVSYTSGVFQLTFIGSQSLSSIPTRKRERDGGMLF